MQKLSRCSGILLHPTCLPGRFGDLADIPFQPILQQIAAFQGRKRSRAKRPL